MTFKIEKDVPVASRCNKGITKYPFDRMDVGDSFFVASDTPAKTHVALSAAAHRALGAGNYVIRKVDGGVRAWRKK